MSVRKRAWTTSKGVEKEAWVVDYVDQAGKRRLKTFTKKKAADNFAATANVEIRAGVHTADSASITIAEAGRLWLETGEKAGLERSTLDAYRQHLRLHIEPYLGNLKLSQLSAPMVREFEDKLARGDMPEGAAAAAPVPCHGPKGSGLAFVAVERCARARSCLPQRRPRASQDAASRGGATGQRDARRASSRSGSTFPRARRSRPLWRQPRAAGGRSC